jgi:hypothetical protein
VCELLPKIVSHHPAVADSSVRSPNDLIINTTKTGEEEEFVMEVVDNKKLMKSSIQWTSIG